MDTTKSGLDATQYDYKQTLCLPQTAFPMKANSVQREPDFQARWDAMGLYGRMQERRAGAPTFMLHDGPPYLSSGQIHLGHALNRVLKDIVIKYKSMNGFRAPFVPGYDCHGLPIENAVLKDVEGGRHAMSVLELRAKCKTFALKNLDGQQARFRRLGILADWEHPYLTMDPDFEARQIGVFGAMAQKGYIYRGLKPVYWCPGCETALAEAEVEYQDGYVSPSIYVKFPLKMTSQAMLARLGRISEPVHFVIWTTTPWTLPANLGIAVHPRLKYTLLKTEGHGHLLVATQLVERFLAETNLVGQALDEFVGAEFELMQAQHPFLPRTSLVVLGEHVTADSGTGVVHTAPGHGLEDYEVGKRYQLPVFAPLNAQGVFTDEAGKLVAGLRYNKANPVVIRHLSETGFLLHEGSLRHSYPHCWRCHKPVIYRGTEQWFCSVEGFREQALAEIKRVKWIPATGERRIAKMVADRSDWCISRQRSWGVPIPIFYCEADHEALLTPESIASVQERFAKEGSDSWWRYEASDLLPAGIACGRCGGTRFRKEQDIMDVWFDSGSSHAAVLAGRSDCSWPADVYLEGTDQYRGWFQSSLLTAVASRGHAPYRTVVTHGFTVDEHGRKMSKSIGNVIEPAKVIEQYGADILRLWVASVDYTHDVRVSDANLKQMAEIYRKIRNTARFILSNLHDFDPEQDRVSDAQLASIDRYALHRLQELIMEVGDALEAYEFFRFYQVIQNYCVIDLSSFYFDIQKDTLYAEKANGNLRRSAQTALYDILLVFTRLIAPVLSHLAEDIWQHVPSCGTSRAESVFLVDWPVADASRMDSVLKGEWEQVMAWRPELLRSLEEARQAKLIGSSLEAQVHLATSDGERHVHWQTLGAEAIRRIAIVSRVVLSPQPIADETVPIRCVVSVAPGAKCQRCWVWSESVGSCAEHDTLCQRCVGALDVR